MWPIGAAMSMSMSKRKASPAQEAEVARLAAEGLPVRKIAAAVFGDARLRGRVERILKGNESEQPQPTEPEPLAIEGLSTLEVFTLLFERRLAAIAAAGGKVSMNELRNLLDVQRQLEAWETVERMNQLTRRVPENPLELG
jgi:hypothetical protein